MSEGPVPAKKAPASFRPSDFIEQSVTSRMPTPQSVTDRIRAISTVPQSPNPSRYYGPNTTVLGKFLGDMFDERDAKTQEFVPSKAWALMADYAEKQKVALTSVDQERFYSLIVEASLYYTCITGQVPTEEKIREGIMGVPYHEMTTVLASFQEKNR